MTPGTAGIRNPGYPRVRIEDSQRRGWIAGFDASVLLTDANRNTVTGLESYDGITLVRSHKATITNSFLGSDWLGCDPLTSHAGLRLIDSDRATIRANAAHLYGLGMVLVRSHNNVLQGNESAPNGSDGSGCSGIVLIDADGNRLIGNTTSQNAGDGIFVDAASQRTVIDGNHAEFNTDDGIDIRNRTTTVLNTTNVENRDLGIESVPGVTASNNRASLNGNPLQCVNVVCSA